MKTLEQISASVHNNISQQNYRANSSILRSLLEKPHSFTLSVTYDGDKQDIQPSGQGLCHVCEQIFISSYYLNNHIMLHHYEQCGVEANENIIRKMKFAILSGNSFTQKQTSNQVENSTVTTDNIEGKQSDCYVCNNLLISRLSLQKHIEVCHKQELSCNICSKICNSVKGLIIHKRIHLKEGLYLCDRCGKDLKINLTQKDYGCSNCGYSCSYHEDFNTNKKVHVKLSLYVCDFCNNTFDEWGKLQKHIRVHNSKKHSCHICKRVFSEDRYLRFHRMIHIEDNCVRRKRLSGLLFKSPTKIKSATGKHVCHLCGKILSRLVIMHNHIYAHAMKKKYLCEICGCQFAYRTSLCAHFRRHTGIKPYTCLCFERGNVLHEETYHK